MSRLKFIEPDEASENTKKTLKELVLIPNILGIMANSEPVIDAFTGMKNEFIHCKLPEKYRKMISLAVSQFNDCEYCVALHTTTALETGVLTEQECLAARMMTSADSKGDLLLTLTKEVLEKRGNIETQLIEKARETGIDDQEIVETIAIISFITMANYMANVADIELDFPEPKPLPSDPMQTQKPQTNYSKYLMAKALFGMSDDVR